MWKPWVYKGVQRSSVSQTLSLFPLDLKAAYFPYQVAISKSVHEIQRKCSVAKAQTDTSKMCERHKVEMTYKDCTATPKHKVERWVPVPCSKHCGNWVDKENMGSSTNKTPGTICPKC
jgi:hypothetical protein